MATLSAETEAIIDRLKREGELLRNSGANSIRSVKFELAKFDNLFQTISSNLIEQTAILQKSYDVNRESIEAARRKEDFEEVAPQAPASPQYEYYSDREGTSAEPEKSESILSALGAGGLLGNIKDLAIGGAGLFVAYNFAKGFIDEKTGGGFTKFENSMIDTFKEIDWTALGTSFKAFATSVPKALTDITGFLDNPLTFLVGSAAALALTGALKGITQAALMKYIADKVLSRSGLPPAGGPDIVPSPEADRRNKQGSKAPTTTSALNAVLKRAGLGLVGGAIFAVEDNARDYVQNQLANIDDGDIAGLDASTVKSLADNGVMAATTTAGTAFTLAAMFGISPLGLPALVIGGTVALGRLAYKYVKEQNDENNKKLKEEYDKLLDKVSSEDGIDPRKLPDEMVQDAARIRAELMRKRQLLISNEEKQLAEEQLKVVDDLLAKQKLDAKKGIAINQQSEIVDRIIAGDQEAYNEMFNYLTELAELRQGGIFNLFGTYDDPEAFAREGIKNLEDTLYGRFKEMTPDQIKEAQRKFLENVERFEGGAAYTPPPPTPSSYKPPRDENGVLLLYDAFGNPVPLTNQQSRGRTGQLLRGELGADDLKPTIVISSPTTIAPQTQIAMKGGTVASSTTLLNASGGNGFGSTVLPKGVFAVG